MRSVVLAPRVGIAFSAMLELFVGGGIGLVVAIVTQWTATGGRLKRMRSTIRDELELLNLLESGAGDPIWEKLRYQARMHIAEYLEDPTMGEASAPYRRAVYRIVYGTLCAVAGAVLLWWGIAHPGGVTNGWAGLALGLTTTLILGMVAWVPTPWIATHLTRRRYSSGLRRHVARRLADGLPADEVPNDDDAHQP